MKALVVSLPLEGLPSQMYPGHWHLVSTFYSRHVVLAIEATYKGCTVTEYEWTDYPPTCGECGEEIGAAHGKG